MNFVSSASNCFYILNVAVFFLSVHAASMFVDGPNAILGTLRFLSWNRLAVYHNWGTGFSVLLENNYVC